MTRHTLLDQVLNRFALESRTFRKFCFTRECERNDRAFNPHRDNVFVAGVARSGSTALLNSLYASEDFASTSYALMPFVLAPSLSQVIGRIPKKAVNPTERKHGDNIEIDLSSAEALDGIFWNTFLPPKDLHLQPREVPPLTLCGYAMFIENILLNSGKNRYLSKMNQSITLIASLACYFDRAVFLVPFRDPLQQASSLLRQHHNFALLSGYEKKYLTWLGHHEFGATHIGFYENHEPSRSAFSPESFNYWLAQWKNSYSYLSRLADLHPNVIPLCYEHMTTSQSFWNRLSSRLNTDIVGRHFVNRNDNRVEPASDTDQSLYDACRSLYERLSEQARSRICSEN